MFAGFPLGNFLKHILSHQQMHLCGALGSTSIRESSRGPGAVLCPRGLHFRGLKADTAVPQHTLQSCSVAPLVHTSMQLPLVSSSNKVWVSLCKTNEMWGRICSLSAFFSDQTSDVSGSFSFHLSVITEETLRKSICSVQALKVRCLHGFCSCRLLLPNLVAILQHV